MKIALPKNQYILQNIYLKDIKSNYEDESYNTNNG